MRVPPPPSSTQTCRERGKEWAAGHVVSRRPGQHHRTGGTWVTCMCREGASRTPVAGLVGGGGGRWWAGPVAGEGSSAEGNRGSGGKTEKEYLLCLPKVHMPPHEGARVPEGSLLSPGWVTPRGVLAPE